MAITDFEFPRFRRKAKEQNGGGGQVLSPTEEREKVVQEEAAAAVANVEADLKAYFTRKQWRFIRISSFLYVLSCIFLLLVSSPQYLNMKYLSFEIDGNWQHAQQAGPQRQLVPEDRCVGHTPLDLSSRRNPRELHSPESRNPRFLPSRAMEFLRRV
jgi:hypothetical protein